MNEKQAQQHRQHFNLSEETKQKLEELTARHYPGKQRRQSQLVEDLIAEAFAKERHMSTGTVSPQDPSDRLAPASYEVLNLAQIKAKFLGAKALYPEHLLLALLEQGHHKSLNALSSITVEDILRIQNLIISLSIVWERYKHREVVKARVTGYKKGGLIVDVSTIPGFVPGSELLNFTREELAAGADEPEIAAKLKGMVGRQLQLKITRVDWEQKCLILSERLTTYDWRLRSREELLDELKPGEVRRGVVTNLANFGAFVDLGGAEGLVHVSQLALSRVNHPSEVLKIGQEVEVQVLSVDKEKKKIALSIKRAGIDPWTTINSRYTSGQLVRGTITRVAPFGAFARIEDGVEGLIRSSELTPGMDPRTSVREGQVWQLRILDIDADRRTLRLSLRQADEAATAMINDAPLEERPPTGEIATSLRVGDSSDTITMSPELLGCLDRAAASQRRRRSDLVQPVHLLIGVLQDERIQSFLAPWLPSPELLSNPTVLVGFSSDEEIRSGSCPFCGRAVQAHWKHCVYCGKSLARACPRCGTPRAEAEGVRFCFECGSPLE